MRLLKKFFGNLQTHIITVFSLLLFISFFMVGFVFNVSVNRYVASGAADVLAQARATNEIRYVTRNGFLQRVFGGNQRILLRDADLFIINEYYEMISPAISLSAQTISHILNEDNIPLVETESKRLRTNGQTFYISISPVLATGGNSYIIFYLDATDIFNFAGVVNRILLALVTFIWLVSMVIAGLLADSMVKPLKVFRDFVRQIGRGDFSQSTFTFTNEEFEELNQSLNHAARQLASYDNDQKTFFQNVSHELRTPLMSIKSYAEGIKYEIMEPKSASETILDAADRLAGMVDDILYVSRIDNLTTPKMTDTNFCKIIEECIKRQQKMADDKGILIKYNSDNMEVIVSCASDYIVRAVDNLISNALRYANREILIECYAIGSRAILKITDDGPGFEEESLPHVFERFYRGKNGITGIGLAMVKSITDQHKGTATAENGANDGAIVTMSLLRKK